MQSNWLRMNGNFSFVFDPVSDKAVILNLKKILKKQTKNPQKPVK